MQFGTSNYDYLYAMAVDSSDNVYIGGYTFGALTGSNAGSTDIWNAQYDSSGTQMGVMQFGTSSYDSLSAMAVDSNDDLLIVGDTQGAFSGYDNSAGELSTSTYYYFYYSYGSGCFNDIWIAKYTMPTPSPTVSIAPTSVADANAFNALSALYVDLRLGPTQGGFECPPSPATRLWQSEWDACTPGESYQGWMTRYPCTSYWDGVGCNSAGEVTALDASLKIHDYSEDQLSAGTIPTEIGMLSTLTALSLVFVSGKGTIPTELGSLTAIQDGLLIEREGSSSANGFMSSSIPSQLGRLSSLNGTFAIGTTNWGDDSTQPYLFGSIPTELAQLTSISRAGPGGVQAAGPFAPQLALGTNDQALCGTIPAEMSSLSSTLTQNYTGHWNGSTVSWEGYAVPEPSYRNCTPQTRYALHSLYSRMDQSYWWIYDWGKGMKLLLILIALLFTQTQLLATQLFTHCVQLIGEPCDDHWSFGAWEGIGCSTGTLEAVSLGLGSFGLSFSDPLPTQVCLPCRRGKCSLLARLAACPKTNFLPLFRAT